MCLDESDYNASSPFASASLVLQLDRVLAEGSAGRWGSPIPGFTISPKSADAPPMSELEIAELKEKTNKVRSTKAGEMLIIDGDYEIKEFKGTVQRMSITEYTNYAEERICSTVGISPTSLQLGSGFQNQVGATAVEENRQSYLNGGFPFLEVLASELTYNVLQRWWPEDFEVRFDTSVIDYETAGNRQAEVDRWLKIGAELGVRREYIAEKLSIPIDQLNPITGAE